MCYQLRLRHFIFHHCSSMYLYFLPTTTISDVNLLPFYPFFHITLLRLILWIFELGREVGPLLPPPYVISHTIPVTTALHPGLTRPCRYRHWWTSMSGIGYRAKMVNVSSAYLASITVASSPITTYPDMNQIPPLPGGVSPCSGSNIGPVPQCRLYYASHQKI